MMLLKDSFKLDVPQYKLDYLKELGKKKANDLEIKSRMINE